MAESDQLPTSFVDPALSRTLQVERAVSHVARAIELELCDIELNPGALTDEARAKLSTLGTALVRLSSITLGTANSIANVLGEELVSQEQNDGTSAKTSTADLPERSQRKEAASGSDKTSGSPKAAAHTPPQQTTPRPPVPTTPRPPQEGAVSAPAHGEPSLNGGASRLDRDNQLGASHSTPEGARSRKKKEYEGELYQAIIPASRTPILELREGMQPIDLIIESDDTIVIAGQRLELEGDRLFAFNAFMKLRDGFIFPKAMRELGVRPSGGGALSGAISSLVKELNTSAGVEVIKRLGSTRDTRYAVNPCVVLNDTRSLVGAGATDVKKK